MEQYIVIALATSTAPNFEDYQIILEGTQFDATHKQVFGPASKEDCEQWVAENCSEEPGGEETENYIVAALTVSLPAKNEQCMLSKEGDVIIATHSKVFGPARKEDCEKWITENCGGEPVPKFIVIALSASLPKYEDCSVIKEDAVFPATHSRVFGPASEDECKKWIAANAQPKGQAGGENPDATPTNYSSSNRGIILLGIYLFLMITLSVVSLAILMRADTDAYLEDGKTLKSFCCGGKFSNVNCNDAANNNANNSNSANTNSNTNANANVNANTNVNANANANTNTNVNANVKANTNTKTNTASNTASNTNANTNTANTKTGQTIDQRLPEMTIPPEVCSAVFGLLSADAFVFLVVFFAGMLGAMIRAAYSFTNHLGLGDFSFKWTWYYMLLPFIGGALSLAIYFVLRGGFYGASFGKGLSLNIYSFAAFSALTGLFTANALEKLRLVAVTLLADVPPKVDNSKEVQKKNEDAKK